MIDLVLVADGIQLMTLKKWKHVEEGLCHNEVLSERIFVGKRCIDNL